MSTVAISYARFSSAPQAQGASLSRQVERAREYAEANSLILDPTLCFEDPGVSAWDQSNLEKGALGGFLRAVDEGKVPKGATLIVESFDRLSRATPLDALPVFLRIIGAGLNLAILTNPPQLFSRATLKESGYQLMAAIIEMSRAHSESEYKSKRVSDAWARRRNAGANSRSGLSAIPPGWIEKHKEGGACRYKLIPERLAIVKQIIQWALAGIGNHSIVTRLNRDAVPPWVRSQSELAKKNQLRADAGLPPREPAWEPSYVQKMLSSPALYGAVRVKGGALVTGVYPPVISEDQFIYLQARRREKATRKSSNRKGATVSNLFGGMLVCGYCQSPMTLSGYTSRKTGQTKRNYACHGARTGKTSCRMHGWDVGSLEESVLFWLTQMNLTDLLGMRSTNLLEEANTKLAVLRNQLAEANKKKSNAEAAILKGAIHLAALHNELVDQCGELLAAIRDQEGRVAILVREDGSGTSRLKGVINLFKALKRPTGQEELRMLRERVASALSQTISTITLYPKGHNAHETADERFADIRFANGVSRRLEAGEC